MKVIYNRFIPFKGYFAINLFGVIFARRGMGRMSRVERNHEYIHTLQQRELLFLPFYLLYLLEWTWWLVRLRNAQRAYHAISFEREAYAHQSDEDYPRHRKWFAQWRTRA